MFNLFRKNNYRNSKIDELYAIINKPPPGTVFIDVRTESEWRAGHIGPFRHIPLGELSDHISELKHHDQIYFLCYSGNRSKIACKMLADSGFNGAVNVLGGISKWIELGHPIVHGV